jgi:hypothetical protein
MINDSNISTNFLQKNIFTKINFPFAGQLFYITFAAQKIRT